MNCAEGGAELSIFALLGLGVDISFNWKKKAIIGVKLISYNMRVTSFEVLVISIFLSLSYMIRDLIFVVFLFHQLYLACNLTSPSREVRVDSRNFPSLKAKAHIRIFTSVTIIDDIINWWRESLCNVIDVARKNS